MGARNGILVSNRLALEAMDGQRLRPGLNAVDQGLYRAKNQGRDHVILAGNPSIACMRSRRYKEIELPKQVGYINVVQH